MEIIYIILVILFVAAAGLLVYLVLSQEPKQGGGDILGGSSTDLFSARGVTGGLYRITVALGAIFAVLAFVLGRIPRG